MTTSRLLKLLYHSGWEFWLPLPLIALLFWVLGNAIAARVLTHSYGSIHALQATAQADGRGATDILSIQATVHRERGYTTVTIQPSIPASIPLEYEFGVVEASQIERAIAQAFTIPPIQVRRLTRYRIADRVNGDE